MNKFLEKNKLILITALLVMFIGGIIVTLFKTNSSIKQLNKELYSFKYDSNWKVNTSSDTLALLKHKSGSIIEISINKINSESRFSNIDDFIDEIVFNIKEQNSNYNLISNKKRGITKYQYEGYVLLLEDGNEQVMLNIFKKSDNIIVVKYQAENAYFDILLDSVNNIIDNLDIKEAKYNIANSLSINPEKIKEVDDESFDKKLVGSKTYSTANNNYNVEYSIPDIYKIRIYDSRYGYYEYSENVDYVLNNGYKTTRDNTSNINVTITNSNIYELLEPNNLIGVYSTSKYKKEEPDKYPDLTESLSKYNDGYLYRCSYNIILSRLYKTDSGSFDFLDNKEMSYVAIVLKPLDNNHTLQITIESNVPITSKLIDMIKVDKYENYAKYVKVVKEDNNLVSSFVVSSNKTTSDLIKATLKVPDKYSEDDKERNLYADKIYYIGENSKLETPDYDIRFILSNLKIEDIVEIYAQNDIKYNKEYGKYQDLKKIGKKKIGDKEFTIYEGGYTYRKSSLISNEVIYYYNYYKVLAYEIPDQGSFTIIVKGYDKKIDDSMLKDFVDFTIQVINK